MSTPSEFNELLRKKNLINEIYEAMESDDYSDVVMAAVNSIVKCNFLAIPRRERKCIKLSESYRNEGNVAFKDGNALIAMHCYNRALRYAPNKSRAMLLAYSNRSAVLFKTGNFAECLLDIETCFRLGCPTDIVDKLNKRKALATGKILNGNMLDELRASLAKFFQICNPNAEVPCASADVDIAVKDGTAKITAAKDIKVGSILAAESSFVACNNFKMMNMGDACRYCFSTSLNLIPCNGCCLVMFCSEKCQRRCEQEYHNVECQIIEVIAVMALCPKTVLTVSGALKFVQMCGTWEQAIRESRCTGSERRRVSTASQMFDAGNKLSILNYEEDNVFVHGIMYESSFVYAMIINSLDRVPCYFPQSPSERALAKRALARIMMYLALYAKPTQVTVIEQPSLQLTNSFPIRFLNHGLCPFIGKLKNSCTPNTIVAYVCKKNVLIALQPIAKGTELTLSHTGHYLDINLTSYEKNLESFLMFGRVCNCFICTNEWKTRSDILTEKQLAAYKKYIQNRFIVPTAPFQNFPSICETLACLSSTPFSQEYIIVYEDFRERFNFADMFMPR